LKQVLYNYLSNALKFSPDEAAITVRVVPEDTAEFRIEVADRGIGIKPEDLGRLFVEFQQLDASTAKRYPGTGLGLALTKRIVEAQGGRVGVRSVPGKGSTFFAVLPLHGNGAAASPPAADTARRWGGDPRILVIEDDPKDQKWLVQTLVAAGCAVEAVATASEAEQRCRNQRYDAITADLLLPDMSGRDLMKAIRSSGPNSETPVVIVTVAAEKGLGIGFHVHDILAKPVSEDDLIGAFRRARVHTDGQRPILVVDDDPRDAKLAARILEQSGFPVLCCVNGEQALEAAAAHAPAAVLLDMVMPGMDGLGFLERFRAMPAGQRIPVIVWTALDLTRERREKLQASAQAIVLKAAGTTALLNELRAFIPLPSPLPAAEPLTPRAA
jgi:CheY-like chemotaxis protein